MSPLVGIDDPRGCQLLLGGEWGPGGLKRHLMRHLVDRALDRAWIGPGGTVAEVSAGSSALALAEVAAERGLHARVHVPVSLGEVGMERLRRAGATVVPAEAKPQALQAVLEELSQLHVAGRVYWTRQNYDEEASVAYDTIAACVCSLFPARALVAGVGTGSALRSFGTALEATVPGARLVAVYSPDVEGLRDVTSGLDLPGQADQGTWKRLRQRFGDALAWERVSCADLARERADLIAAGVSCGDATAAVLHVMRRLRLEHALGISVDGRRVDLASQSDPQSARRAPREVEETP